MGRPGRPGRHGHGGARSAPSAKTPGRGPGANPSPSGRSFPAALPARSRLPCIAARKYFLNHAPQTDWFVVSMGVHDIALASHNPLPPPASQFFPPSDCTQQSSPAGCDPLACVSHTDPRLKLERSRVMNSAKVAQQHPLDGLGEGRWACRSRRLDQHPGCGATLGFRAAQRGCHSPSEESVGVSRRLSIMPRRRAPGLAPAPGPGSFRFRSSSLATASLHTTAAAGIHGSEKAL